ncbi:MAG: hypothetical protein ABSB40_05015 [Nitrososphaeria archaeon]|jgi:hypothetical protein
MKGTLNGGFKIYPKSVNNQARSEDKIKEKIFEENGIIDLDKYRPDGFKNQIWYEIKVGSEVPLGKDWGKGSKYFPHIFFSTYNLSMDEQIRKYVEEGFIPLKVLVFDKLGQELGEKEFKSEGDL